MRFFLIIAAIFCLNLLRYLKGVPFDNFLNVGMNKRRRLWIHSSNNSPFQSFISFWRSIEINICKDFFVPFDLHSKIAVTSFSEWLFHLTNYFSDWDFCLVLTFDFGSFVVHYLIMQVGMLFVSFSTSQCLRFRRGRIFLNLHEYLRRVTVSTSFTRDRQSSEF